MNAKNFSFLALNLLCNWSCKKSGNDHFGQGRPGKVREIFPVEAVDSLYSSTFNYFLQENNSSGERTSAQ